jgi:hypothetical protein
MRTFISMMTGVIPYTWFWILGGLMMGLGLLSILTLTGWVVMGTFLLATGSIVMVTGEIERRKGAWRE